MTTPVSRGGASADPPPVTAVVLNWCDEEASAACVESLLASAYPALTTLIVDNGSPDGSGDRLRQRFPDVDFLQTGANLGYAGGNNRGIERALERGARYVLVLNNDTWVGPDVVASLVDAAESAPRAGAVAPTVVAMDDPAHVWYAGGAFDPVRALGVHWTRSPAGSGQPNEVTFFPGCSVLLRARALRDVGPFEESYFLYVEDAELSVRLVRGGWGILHDPRVHIVHRLRPEGVDPSPDQIRYRDRNRRRLARTHLGATRRMLFLGWFAATRSLHLLRYVARGDIARATAILRGMTER